MKMNVKGGLSPYVIRTGKREELKKHLTGKISIPVFIIRSLFTCRKHTLAHRSPSAIWMWLSAQRGRSFPCPCSRTDRTTAEKVFESVRISILNKRIRTKFDGERFIQGHCLESLIHLPILEERVIAITGNTLVLSYISLGEGPA